MRAAVAAGLGVTCRTDLVAGWGGLPVVPEALLPKLPEVGYVLLQSEDPTEAGRRLGALTEGALRRRGARLLPSAQPDSPPGSEAHRLAARLSGSKSALEKVQRQKACALC
jgi:hypothetical protein